MAETHSPKRYTGRKSKADKRSPRVFACANCEVLSETARDHTITCSNACRVALHRHPERLAHWQKFAELGDVTVQDILDANAAQRLLEADEIANVERGELNFADLRRPIYLAYVKRVFDAARACEEVA